MLMSTLATSLPLSRYFFSNHPATPHIYTLSLHDALPISPRRAPRERRSGASASRGSLPPCAASESRAADRFGVSSHAISARFCCFLRSEEHTSELQSRLHLVCRLLLEKKKNKYNAYVYSCYIAASISLFFL